MSGFLARLSARALGVAETVRPVIAPLYAGWRIAPDDQRVEPADLEIDETREVEPARDRPAPRGRPAPSNETVAAEPVSPIATIRPTAAVVPPGTHRDRHDEPPAAGAVPERSAERRTEAAPDAPPARRPAARRSEPRVDATLSTPSGVVAGPVRVAAPRPTTLRARSEQPEPVQPLTAAIRPSEASSPTVPAPSPMLVAPTSAVGAPRVVTRLDPPSASRRTGGPGLAPVGRAMDEERTVEISIGRIEIRATPGAAPVATPTAQRRTAVSLDAYLLARSREGRA